MGENCLSSIVQEDTCTFFVHPFSLVRSFSASQILFVTLCFYCFFWLKPFFSGHKKTALRLFLGARYWIRTSDPRRVKAMLYH